MSAAKTISEKVINASNMIKLACGVKGCWPILVATTTTTTEQPTTIAAEADVRVAYLQDYSHTIFVVSASTVAVMLLVIAVILKKILSRMAPGNQRGEP